MDLDAYPEFPEGADRLGEIHLSLVDVDAQFLELALDVARGHGPVQPVLFADLHGEGELDAFELPSFALGRLALDGALLGEPVCLERDALSVALRGRIREPFRQQEVAGVAVLYLDDLAGLPEVLHVFAENDFHCSPHVWDGTIGVGDCPSLIDDTGAGANSRRVCHDQASARPASVCSTSSTGAASLNRRTSGSSTENRRGTSEIAVNAATVAARVSSQCSSPQAIPPHAAQASPSVAAAAQSTARTACRHRPAGASTAPPAKATAAHSANAASSVPSRSPGAGSRVHAPSVASATARTEATPAGRVATSNAASGSATKPIGTTSEKAAVASTTRHQPCRTTASADLAAEIRAHGQPGRAPS